MTLESKRGGEEPVLVVPARLTKIAYAALVANDLVPRRWHAGGRHGSRTHKIVDCDDGGGGDAKCDGVRMGLPLIASDEVVDMIESMLALGGRDVADRVVEDDDAIEFGRKDLHILEPDRGATGGEMFDGDGNGNNEPTLDSQEQHGGHCSSDIGAQRKLEAKGTTQTDDGDPLSSLRRILSTPGVELIYNKEPVPFKNVPRPPKFDATVHPERAPPSFPQRIQHFLDDYVLEGGSLTRSEQQRQGGGANHRAPLFTFCELFAGIGGFGVALEAMGGRCVFASEIDESARRIYRANVGGVGDEDVVLAGDIWEVDADDLPDHDLLVGGFPCQPFSSLGDQPGLADGKSCLRKGRVSRADDGDASTAIAVTNRRNTKGDDDDSSDECDGEVDIGRGRGLLYTQIVRILEKRRPRAVLLENVPGLLRTDGGRAMRTIVEALEGAAAGGYVVTHEVVNSRGLTAQSRKRLYIVGLRKKTSYVGRRLEVTGSVAERGDTTDRMGTGAEGGAAAFGSSPGTSSTLDYDDDSTGPHFEFPFLPDLGLRAGDVLHSEDELRTLSLAEMGVPPISPQDGEQLDGGEKNDDRSPTNPPVVVPSDLFRLTDRQMCQLLSRCPKYWKPSKLAWDDVTCDTIDGHYGVSVGKGHSQLVPCRAPLHPRRFTPRECARIMGFGDDWFDMVVEWPPPCPPGKNVDDLDYDDDDRQCEGTDGFRAVIKQRYRLLGNAVCPPVVAGIAGAILDLILAPPPPFPRRVAVARVDVACAADGGPSKEVEGGDDDWDSRPIDRWTDVGLGMAVGLALDAVPAVRRGDVVDRLRRTPPASPSHSRSPPSPMVAV